MVQESNTIGWGSRVRMHFSIHLADGTVAESTLDDEPIEITIGAGDIHEGLEASLIGLKSNDKQSQIIPPDKAFGYHDPNAIHTMSRRDFSPDLKLERGMLISFKTPAGDDVPGLIRSVSEEEVEVDFNHPLAGHVISFSVEILDITNTSGH